MIVSILYERLILHLKIDSRGTKSATRHVAHTCARHIEVICAPASTAEMELHSKVARLCLQTAKRPGEEGERVREG
jgi:hypothetical protein